MQKIITAILSLLISFNTFAALHFTGQASVVNHAESVARLIPSIMQEHIDYDINIKVTNDESSKLDKYGSIFNRKYQILFALKDSDNIDEVLLSKTLEILDREKVDDSVKSELFPEYNYCVDQIEDYKITHSDKRQRSSFLSSCYSLVEAASFSGHSDFLTRAGWAITCSGVGCIKQYNTDNTRQINGEYASFHAAFAVNFAKFLLDPSYRARRPSLYEYFSKTYGIMPHDGASFARHNSVPVHYSTFLDSGRESITIDPERIYRIDFAIAGPSEGHLESTFGHSLIKVVACAPDSDFGPDCLYDYDYHYFISYGGELYRGVIEALDQAKLSDIVLGRLPGVMYFYNYRDLINTYQYIEGRNTKFYPLKMSRDEIRRFANRALEEHFHHTGHYNFFSRNCADKAFELIRAGLNYDIRLQNEYVTLPSGIPKVLKKYGIIDESQSYTVIGKTELIKRSIFKTGFDISNEALSEAILNFTPQDIENLRPQLPSYLFNNIKNYYEVNIGHRYVKHVESRILKMAKQHIDDKMLGLLNLYDETLSKLETVGKIKPGYGIPLQSEVTPIEISRSDLNKELREQLLKIIDVSP